MFYQIAKRVRQLTMIAVRVKDKDLIKYKAPESRLMATTTAMVGGITSIYLTEYLLPPSSLMKYTPPSSHIALPRTQDQHKEVIEVQEAK